jgi:hypothetical protein
MCVCVCVCVCVCTVKYQNFRISHFLKKDTAKSVVHVKHWLHYTSINQNYVHSNF